MRNKFDLRKPVYHKSYGKMIIERYIEANLYEPDTENQYDCEYKYDYMDRKRSSLFKESTLMTEEDYLTWEVASKREEILKNILKED